VGQPRRRRLSRGAMQIDPDLKPFLPILAIVCGGFVLGVVVLVIAVFTGP
jgi:hypothetical protein